MNVDQFVESLGDRAKQPLILPDKDQRIAELESQLKRYREALEQYADRKNWSTESLGTGRYDIWVNDDYNGYELAERALKEGE